MFGASPTERAYLAPFLAFFAVMGLGLLVEPFGDGRAFWAWSETRYWVCPLQTLVCGAILIRYWRVYALRVPQKPMLTSVIAAIALLLWIAPQEWLGAAKRWEGFNPEFFGAAGGPYILNLGLRLVRLVVVVPLVEEVFWRGFLLRFLISEDFAKRTADGHFFPGYRLGS